MGRQRMLSAAAALLVSVVAAADTYEAPRDARRTTEAKFTRPPKATKVAGEVKIAFAVSAATDVEVAVLDRSGRVVRHLAAGLLGDSAPPPLKAGALAQELTWDGRDDAGAAAGDGPFRVRVRLGCRPRLERIAGWDGNTMIHRIVALAVGPKGEVFVAGSEGTRGWSEMIVLDRQGQYLRTIMPYPADTPPERTASIGQLEIEGERLPIVFNAHGHNLLPLVSGLARQTMAFSPAGHLLLASAVGTICNHGPPRHLLAMHPAGGAPEGVGFIGPRIRRSLGFLGGAGEANVRSADHIAASPDGAWIYLTTHVESWASTKLRHHAVFRLKWSDAALGRPFLGAKDPGDDDGHFNDPQGLATDAAGRLYVCDRGNDRVCVFDPSGKRLGEIAVDDPWQVAVHPKSGHVYVLCRGLTKQGTRVRDAKETHLVKFSAWAGAAPKPLARLERNTVRLMALDGRADPPRLWAALEGGWQQGDRLVAVTDRGERFEVGEPVTNTDALGYPMYIAADPVRERVYVTQRGSLKLLDLKTGKLRPFPKKRVQNATEPAVDARGNVYVTTGWALGLERFDPEGEPLPFAALATHRMASIHGRYPGGKTEYLCRASGVCYGARGHVVAANGDLYVLKMNGNGHGGTLGQLDVYAPDGTLKKQALVARTVGGSSGLAVDPAGNIYIGSNLKPPTGSPLPWGFEGKAPAKGWTYWRAPRPAPWAYPYYNPYLFHWGAIFKFPPSGGEYFGAHDKRLLKDHPEVAVEPPAGAARYRNGYLGGEVFVGGAVWRYGGFGPVPDGTRNWGDPSCACTTGRFAADGFGRLFAPNVFRFSVEMLDAAGNHLARIGRYGNADSAGAASKVPRPEIAFAFPGCVAAAGGKLYVSDPANRRITVVGFAHAAEETCPVR